MCIRDSIQAAVDRARPGDTVEIPYGVYHERVAVDMSDITSVSYTHLTLPTSDLV